MIGYIIIIIITIIIIIVLFLEKTGLSGYEKKIHITRFPPRKAKAQGSLLQFESSIRTHGHERLPAFTL